MNQFIMMKVPVLDKNEMSYPELVYPSLRDSFLKSPFKWLEGRIVDDGAEGLWRIHDKLYDFSSFIKSHPGGQNWLILSKGIDITEAFESHHISTTPEKMLEKYFVRNAVKKRNSPFTFHKDGFYNTLKGRVREEIKKLPKDLNEKSNRIMEGLVICMFAFSIGACLVNSSTMKAVLCVLGGISMGWVANCGHNFLHQKDNWRMYMFNFSLLSTREFRISHVLSHHLYTNTLSDMEITMLEPFFQYIPSKSKGIVARYGPFVYGLILYPFFFHAHIISRYIAVFKYKNYPVLHWEDLIVFIVPIAMYLMGGGTLKETLLTWLFITNIDSFVMVMTTLHAAHHHPENFHDGDAPCENKDWGLHQLRTVMDRVDINDSLFKVLTNFGDHGLHHLFPAIDHAILEKIRPVFFETCKEFETECRMSNIVGMFFASFRQLARNEPNLKAG